MGREVRMVPADWQHPKEYDNVRREERYVPLHDGRGNAYAEAVKEWDLEWSQWQIGLVKNYGDPAKPWRDKEGDEVGRQYTWYSGRRPSPDDYMPNWSEDQRTHYMMYEDTTEGTPKSPAFATPEELARYCADNNVSAFGYEGASYEAWLRVCKGGYAPSMVISLAGVQSGVEALTDIDDA